MDISYVEHPAQLLVIAYTLNKWCILSLLLWLSFSKATYSLQLYFYWACVLHENKGFWQTSEMQKSKVDFWTIPDICPGVGLLDHTATLFLVFWGTSIPLSIVAAPIYIPNSSVGGFPFLETLILISKVYSLSSFRDGLFSEVTEPSGPHIPAPEVGHLVSEAPRFYRRAKWSRIRCTTLPLLGCGWPKTLRDTFTPQILSHLLHTAAFLSYLIPSLTSGPQCFGTASGRPRINVTLTWQWLPLHILSRLNIYKHYFPRVPQILQPFLPGFWGLPQSGFLISPNPINC